MKAEIQAAAQFWADMFRAKVSSETGNALEEALAQRFEKLFVGAGWDVSAPDRGSSQRTIWVDYHPCPVLAEAIAEAGISAAVAWDCLPTKAAMWISPDRVVYRPYQGRPVDVYNARPAAQFAQPVAQAIAGSEIGKIAALWRGYDLAKTANAIRMSLAAEDRPVWDSLWAGQVDEEVLGDVISALTFAPPREEMALAALAANRLMTESEAIAPILYMIRVIEHYHSRGYSGDVQTWRKVYGAVIARMEKDGDHELADEYRTRVALLTLQLGRSGRGGSHASVSGSPV